MSVEEDVAELAEQVVEVGAHAGAQHGFATQLVVQFHTGTACAFLQ